VRMTFELQGGEKGVERFHQRQNVPSFIEADEGGGVPWDEINVKRRLKKAVDSVFELL